MTGNVSVTLTAAPISASTYVMAALSIGIAVALVITFALNRKNRLPLVMAGLFAVVGVLCTAIMHNIGDAEDHNAQTVAAAITRQLAVTPVSDLHDAIDTALNGAGHRAAPVTLARDGRPQACTLTGLDHTGNRARLLVLCGGQPLPRA